MRLTELTFTPPLTGDRTDPVIGVRITIGSTVHKEMAQWVFPGQNRVGTDILRRLLAARLQAAGVEVTGANSGFEFNYSMYLFVLDSASEIGRAMGIISKELEDIGLSLACQVGFWDARELVWRLQYPRTGAMLEPTPEQFAAERAAVEALKKLAEVVLNAAKGAQII